MSRIVVGVIGLGPGAEPHAKSLHDLADRVEVRAAASRTPERCQAFADRFGFPTTTDIDAVITQSVSILARNVHQRPEYFTFMFRERMSGIESVRAAIRHELDLLERELATDLARLPGPADWSTEDLRVLSNLIVGMMVNTTEAILTAPRPEVGPTHP